ncbi:MAG: gamma-glutamyl-gamma-aminobutyrate hydrolase family protein [Candidatus Gracilibacteria bacterium]
MKKVLIAPRFFQLGNTYRSFATNSIGEFLIEQGILPVLAFYSTDLSSYKDAQDYVEDLFSIEEFAGIILQGGNDISAVMYGEEEENTQGVQPFRDYYELALIRYAFERNIPVFGICRGLQMINISLGGTLYQHLEEEDWHTHIKSSTGSFIEKDIEQIEHTFHPVVLRDGGVLKEIFSESELSVNSYHHQGIKDLGKELFVEAVGIDGLVEAVSNKEKGILGVQWHPELDWKNKDFAEPFLWWLREYILEK